MGKLRHLAIAAGTASLIAGAAQAATIDADLVFVIDQSGSMSNEYTNLGAGIDSFVNQLEADSRIGSIQVALVDYTTSASLRFDLTSDLSVFDGLTRGSGSGTENALGAIDYAVTTTDISYRTDSVKSIILITDEDADDDFSYTNAFGTGASALAALLDDLGFLNNVIYEFSDSGTDEFDTIARPVGATFDINDFRADPTAFLASFANAKLTEIIDVGGGGGGGDNPGVVPLPASMPLVLAGLGALGLLRRRQRG